MSNSEWERRKEIKKCSLLAQKQNCTDVSNFEYHCVINEYENALIEVCAPAYIINGEFLKTKKIIWVSDDIFNYIYIYIYNHSKVLSIVFSNLIFFIKAWKLLYKRTIITLYINNLQNKRIIESKILILLKIW